MSSPRLLLDEHYSDTIARRLRERSHDVAAVVANPELRGRPDDEIFEFAARMGRRIVTENVKDFRPLLRRAYEQDLPHRQLLLVPPARFPRGKHRVGITEALHAWLSAPNVLDRPDEDWLV